MDPHTWSDNYLCWIQTCGAVESGMSLIFGQSAVSCDGRFELRMQGDGNLVLYQDSAAIWASGTFGNFHMMHLQSDGNIVITQLGTPVWSTGTHGNPGARLRIQNDGNLVLYSTAGAVLWQSGTCCR